jgi:hypothetical protein
VNPQSEEPIAVVPHDGICGSPGGVTSRGDLTWLTDDAGFSIFWEFNGADLCLKAKLGKRGEEWAAIKDELTAFCEAVPGGRAARTTRSGATHATAYKWQWNIYETAASEVARRTAEVIATINPSLKGWMATRT